MSGCRILLFAAALLSVYQASAYQCQRGGKKVDWFINYKLAKDNSHAKASVKNGVGFIQMTSSSPSWKLCKKSINDSSDTYVADTLSQYYKDDKKREKMAAFFSDQPPLDGSKPQGNPSKGFLFGEFPGIVFCVHSVPKFPLPDKFQWPAGQESIAHTIACVSIHIRELDSVAKSLRYSSPKFYVRYLSPKIEVTKDTKEFFDRVPLDVKYCTTWSRSKTTDTAGHPLSFSVLGMRAKCKQDIYAEAISKSNEASFAVWAPYDNEKDFQKIACEAYFKSPVLKAKSIKISVQNQEFTITRDRDASKLAISAIERQRVVCISSQKRTKEQMVKGNSALCLKSAEIAKGFESFVKDGQPQCNW